MMGMRLAARAAVTVLAIGIAGALAEPALADQTQEFYGACMKISHDTRLCTCKAEVAPKIADSRMIGYVIASMEGKGGSIPADVMAKWNNYVAESNKRCKPGY